MTDKKKSKYIRLSCEYYGGFYFKKDSRAFEKIAKRYGINIEKLNQEFDVRAKLLYELQRRKIFNFNQTQKIINEYHKNPRAILESFGLLRGQIKIDNSNVVSFINTSYLQLFKVTNSNCHKERNKSKMTDVVKINEDLLKKVKKLIKEDSMKIKYSNAKQFVNIAVLEKLEKEDGGKKK